MRLIIDIKCPHCETEIKELGVTRPGDEGPGLGDIIVCGNCGGVCQIGLGQVEEFTAFDGLSPAEQADLKFAIKAVKANAKRFKL